MFKTSERLLFYLFGYFSNTKNVRSKQAGGCFSIYLGTFLIQKRVFKTSGRLLFNLFGYFSNTKKCVFKTSGRLLFNLFGYFCNTKNVCSKQAGDVLFSLLINIITLRLQFLWNLPWRMLFKLLLFRLFSKLHKNSADGCVLVHSSTFIKLK